MMKPGHRQLRQVQGDVRKKYTQEAGYKKQFLIPYFIAAHPGTSDEDMMHLAIWLKKTASAPTSADFHPSTMATGHGHVHTGINTLGACTAMSGRKVDVVRGEKAPPPAQGVPALPRPEELAAAARRAQGHGPRRPDWQRQAPSDSDLPAHGR